MVGQEKDAHIGLLNIPLLIIQNMQKQWEKCLIVFYNYKLSLQRSLTNTKSFCKEIPENVMTETFVTI